MPGFRPATRSAGSSGKASGKAAAKPGKPGHTTPAKPGGCGTGAGGFQAGNTCGHKGNRNQKVETARAAHAAAKNDVLKHVKAHRKATKAAMKAGESAPAPKDLHAAIKKAAAAHGELKAARDTHRAEQRDKRNVKARERRAVQAGRAEPLAARPKPAGPSLREQADKHRAAQSQAIKDRDSPNSFRDPSEFRDRKLNATKAVREQLIHAASRGRQALKSKINDLKQRANPGSAAERGVRYGSKLLESSRLKPKTKPGPATPTTPPHTGLTSSQARPSATTPPSRNDRLAVLAARHDLAGKRLATLRDESAEHAYTAQTLAGKGNVNPESPTQRGRYAESHAIGRRADIHRQTADRLRESIHDPAKSGAAARTLKSLGNNPVGSRANESAIRGVAGKLTHSELKAAATGAGLDHGGARNRYELRDHLLRTVGKSDTKSGSSLDNKTRSGMIQSGKTDRATSTRNKAMQATKIESGIPKTKFHAFTPEQIKGIDATSVKNRRVSGAGKNGLVLGAIHGASLNDSIARAGKLARTTGKPHHITATHGGYSVGPDRPFGKHITVTKIGMRDMGSSIDRDAMAKKIRQQRKNG